MRTIALASGTIETTRLGFGCAHLMRSPRAERDALLATAFEAGIRHFDVARMYGLGAAEAEVGRFARGRRDELVIATKFGIPPPVARPLARLQDPGRRLLARSRRLRELARRRATASRAPRVYDAATARASLETSLRELGTDHVDLLFLHEPEDGDDVRADDVRAELERARAAGLLRAWGVSGDRGPSAAVAHAFPAPVVLQLRDDVLVRPRADDGIRADLTFAPLATALDTIDAHVRGDEARAARWAAALGTAVDRPGLARILLADALQANQEGVVLFSTGRAERIEAAAEVAESGAPAPAVAALRRLVDSELRR